MKKFSNPLMIFILLILARGASAETNATMITAGQLLNACESKHVENTNLCAGYIAANIDVLVSLAASDIIENAVCVPVNVQVGTVAAPIISYLKQHPEVHSLNASSVILDELIVILPCS